MNKATWPWAPLPPPSGGGVPETFGGLAEAGRRRNLSCRNNDVSCLLKKLPFKKKKTKKMRWGLSHSKRVPGDGPGTRGGAGAPPPWALTRKDLSSAGCVYIQGPTLGVAYARGGKGALASGNMVSLPWPPSVACGSVNTEPLGSQVPAPG